MEAAIATFALAGKIAESPDLTRRLHNVMNTLVGECDLDSDVLF